MHEKICVWNKRLHHARISVSTMFKGHSCCQCDRGYMGRGSTRVVMGGGDVNGL